MTETRNVTLLPCPFCGGEAFVNNDPTGNGGKPHMSGNVGLCRLWSVECDECGADGGFWQEREIAIAAWNTRTATGDDFSRAVHDGHLWRRCDACECGAVLMTEENMAAHGWVRERTCRCTTDDNAWCFACSECGKTFPRSELHYAHNHGEINYCPNCGAKVV